MQLTIPPDVRVIIDAFIERKLAEHFGETPPTPEEEAAFLEGWLARGVATVPMLDGGEVTIAGGAPGGPVLAESQAAAGRPAAETETLRVIPLLVFLALVVAAGIFLLAPRSPRDAAQTPDTPETALPNPAALLPEGIDALVTSGEVRVPLVVPRTMELRVHGALTGTTYIVVPVPVQEADWPCPQPDPADGGPVGCWVFGTVVNYLVGVPSDGASQALARALQAHGGTVHLRLSTGAVLSFAVDSVRAVERQEIEVLAQRRPGLTVPLLGGEGARRWVIAAAFDDGAYGAAPAGPEPEAGRAPDVRLRLGDEVQIGPLHLRPLSSARSGATARLTLLVDHRSPRAVEASEWAVTAQSPDFRRLPAVAHGAVPAQGAGTVTLEAPGEVESWQLVIEDTYIEIKEME